MEDGLNFDGINAPTPLDQVKRVEKHNNLAINVFGYENNSIVYYRMSKQPGDISRKNILLILKEDTSAEGDVGIKTHYVWIKDFNRLLFDQTKNEHRKHFCEMGDV